MPDKSESDIYENFESGSHEKFCCRLAQQLQIQHLRKKFTYGGAPHAATFLIALIDYKENFEVKKFFLIGLCHI